MGQLTHIVKDVLVENEIGRQISILSKSHKYDNKTLNMAKTFAKITSVKYIHWIAREIRKNSYLKNSWKDLKMVAYYIRESNTKPEELGSLGKDSFGVFLEGVYDWYRKNILPQHAQNVNITNFFPSKVVYVDIGIEDNIEPYKGELFMFGRWASKKTFLNTLSVIGKLLHGSAYGDVFTFMTMIEENFPIIQDNMYYAISFGNDARTEANIDIGLMKSKGFIQMGVGFYSKVFITATHKNFRFSNLRRQYDELYDDEP